MQTKTIQQNEWSEFFNVFSRRHQGKITSIEILGSDIGAQLEQKGLALEGITSEWDEVTGNTIMIMAGGKPDDHVTHSINRPREVSLEQTDEGVDAALAIKAADGTTSLLRFRARALPELVNALRP